VTAGVVRGRAEGRKGCCARVGTRRDNGDAGFFWDDVGGALRVGNFPFFSIDTASMPDSESARGTDQDPIQELDQALTAQSVDVTQDFGGQYLLVCSYQVRPDSVWTTPLDHAERALATWTMDLPLVALEFLGPSKALVAIPTDWTLPNTTVMVLGAWDNQLLSSSVGFGLGYIGGHQGNTRLTENGKLDSTYLGVVGQKTEWPELRPG